MTERHGTCTFVCIVAVLTGGLGSDSVHVVLYSMSEPAKTTEAAGFGVEMDV